VEESGGNQRGGGGKKFEGKRRGKNLRGRGLRSAKRPHEEGGIYFALKSEEKGKNASGEPYFFRACSNGEGKRKAIWGEESERSWKKEALHQGTEGVKKRGCFARKDKRGC